MDDNTLQRCYERGVAQVSRDIDALTGQAPGLTLGSAVALMETAISYGVTLYNEGDHHQCYALYAQTATLIVEAAGDLAADRPQTRALIDDLRRALERAELAPTASESAWAMRHAFDKSSLTYQITAEHLRGLVRLGELAFIRGDFGGAVDALRPADALAQDILIVADNDSLQATFVATIFLGHALLGVGHYREAAEALRRGILAMPRWLETDFDMAELREHSPPFDLQLRALEGHLEAHPGDRHARLLSGYVALFSGQGARAGSIFQSLLQSEPLDELVHLLLAATLGQAEALS